MDFSKIRSKINLKEYANPHIFEEDMRLIFSNAMLYNKVDRDKVGSVYQLAEELELHFERAWALATSVLILYADENITKNRWKKEELAKRQEEENAIRKIEYAKMLEKEREENEGFVERERIRRQRYALEMQRKVRAECPMLSKSELKEEEDKIYAYRRAAQAKAEKLRIVTEDRAVQALENRLRNRVNEMDIEKENKNEESEEKVEEIVEKRNEFKSFALGGVKKRKKMDVFKAFSQGKDREEKMSSSEKKLMNEWNKKVSRLFKNRSEVVDDDDDEEEEEESETNDEMTLFQVYLLFKEKSISIQSDRPAMSSKTSFEILKRGGDILLNRSEELEIDVVGTVKSKFIDLGILSPFTRSKNICLEITCKGKETRELGLSSLKSRLLRMRSGDLSLFSASYDDIEMSKETRELGIELESTTWLGEPSGDSGVYLGMYGSDDGKYVKIFGVNGMVSVSAFELL
jgi:hypothetical protein